MFSPKLERRWRLQRLAIWVAATVFVAGIVLIVIWALHASSMLEAAGVDRTPIIAGVLFALAGLLLVCLIAYGAVRAFERLSRL